MDLENRVKGLAFAGVVGLAIICFSCSIPTSLSKRFNLKEIVSKPRVRMGSYATNTIGTNFLGSRIGKHSYEFSLSEKNGIVYTNKAGHIDIAHLRKATDYTAYLASKTYGCLMESKSEFSFEFKDGSKHCVEINYPKNWGDLSEEVKKNNAKEISIGLGEYFSYTGTTWHEILTWFGYKSTGIFSDFPSAFSWEDGFSNVLGAYIGGKALRDDKHSFSEAVTIELDNELEKLDIQSKKTSKKAAAKMRGKWYTGEIMFVNMKKRNFDIGIDDGYVSPTLIPDVDECLGAEPLLYSVPDLDFVNESGFSIKYEIEPYGAHGKRIQKIVGKKKIDPETDFSIIMNYIKNQAIKRYGEDVDVY